MRASHFDFVDVVAADRGLVVTNTAEHVCRLEPSAGGLAWYCDLDDGTPTGDTDPASFVRWVCPSLRVRGAGAGGAARTLDVRRSGPRSDLARLVQRMSRLAGRASVGGADGELDGRYVYTDPAEILDAALRGRIEDWPSAMHGDGVVRPAELSSIRLTREGLVVESVSWWGSAAVLDHQILLAIDLARRLAALS